LQNVSDRTALLGFSDIVRIRNRVLAMIGRGERVLRLEGGEPFMTTPKLIKDAMRNALDANETRYAPSSGIAALLEAIRAKLAQRNAVEVTTDDIIVTSGGAHGLFCAFQATLNPGDDVMLFAPYWTPIRDQVHYSGGELVRVPWSETRGVDDLTAVLEAHHTPRTRVFYVNTPSNPTGDVLSRAQLESVARFAVAHDLIVISDEAYEDLVYDGAHVSIASLPGMRERTLSVYTLSKSFAMTGWRVGYVVAQKPWMDALKKLVLNSINGVSTPSQFAAAAAVSQGRTFIDAMLPEYRMRRDRLAAGLADAGFECVPPHGAFYLFADARERLGGDSWQAMETLLSRTAIASVPGVVFGPEGEGFLRMSFSTSLDVIEQAVAALAAL
jgi:aspartate aminotransferase